MLKLRRAAVTALTVALVVPMVSPARAGASDPSCRGLPATIVGTDGDDDLIGTDGDDVIVAFGGSDTIIAGDGNDVVCAGVGDDYVDAGPGDDIVDGDAGQDEILGGAGADQLFGGDGNDLIDGGSGSDVLSGAAGADVLIGSDGDDQVQGDTGHDDLSGGAGDDVVGGGDGNDTLDGGLGIDALDAGYGQDSCRDGEVVVSCESHESTTPPDSSGPGLCAGEVPTLVGTDGDDVLVGTPGDDVVLGLGGHDRIDTGAGDDIICAGPGDDDIVAGPGFDEVRGGDGNDSIDAGDQDDLVDGGDGDDVILAGAGFDDVEGGLGSDFIDGGSGEDRLTGGPGDDEIYGGSKGDYLDGGTGTDVLDGGFKTDVCVSGETLLNCELDGTEDLDGDLLVDLLEDKLGTNKRKSDTDGDGLTDYFEAAYGIHVHVPTSADTDGDGMADGDEDYDHDGLSAAEEQRLATNPLIADTDGDRVGDGDEVINGTNPLVPDQPVTTSSASAGAIEVALTGFGDLSDTVRIFERPDDRFDGAPGQLTPAFQIDLDPYGAAHLQSATITWAYADAVVSDESQLRIFTWDEDVRAWSLPGDGAVQAVDVDANTVTVDVSHFSTFGLFDLGAWLDYWNGLPVSCGGGGGEGDATPVKVALALDSSGSMGWNDPSGLRRDAAKRFVDLLRVDDPDPANHDLAAIIDFDSRAQVFQGLTDDAALLYAAIDRVNSSGGTNLSAAMSTSLSALGTFDPGSYSEVIVLLTDGVGSYSHFYTDRAVDRGVTVYTVGLGRSVDASLLQTIASTTGGEYFAVSQASDLEDIFVEIGGEVTGNDQDGDGLDDCAEVEGMVDAQGTLYFSDPTLADTDGDLLPDGIEMGELRVVEQGIYPSDASFYDPISDPSDANTDVYPGADEFDLTDDGFEFANGTNPDRLDSENEFEFRFYDVGFELEPFDDNLEYLNDMDPTDLDTDGDGYSDYYEFFAWQFDWENTVHLNLDPLVVNSTTSAEAWAQAYADGFLCGDLYQLCPWVDDTSSIPYILGSVVSGFGGPVPDARDLLGNLFRLDLTGTALSAVAFIPIAGDTTAAVGRATRTLKQLTGPKKQAAIKELEDANLPDGIVDDIVEELLGKSIKTLKQAGISDEALDTFRKSGVDLDALADAVKLAAPSTIPSPGFLSHWRKGEQALRASAPGFAPKGRGFADPAVAGSRRNFRIVDAYNSGTKTALESKSGRQWMRRDPNDPGKPHPDDKLKQQIDRDRALLNARTVPIEQVTWHFFASDVSGYIADDPVLFNYLRANNIPYEIHLP